MDFELFTDEFDLETLDTLESRGYGVPSDYKDFSVDRSFNQVPTSVLADSRIRVDRALKKYRQIWSDVDIAADPDIESLVDNLDRVLHHEWVGGVGELKQTLFEPLNCIALTAKSPMLDLGEKSLIQRCGQRNHPVFDSYDRCGPTEDHLLDEKKILSSLYQKVRFVDLPEVHASHRDYETIFLGTSFHTTVATMPGRREVLEFLSQKLSGEAYFVFPDPLALTYNGMLNKKETDSFEVICCYPPSDTCIDGALDIKVLGKEYYDPVIKKRTFNAEAEKWGLECLFIRADQFVGSVYTSDAKVKYDRKLLQNYCVGIIKRRGEVFRVDDGAVKVVPFQRNKKLPSSSKKDPLPKSAKGMPLPMDAVPNWVSGDVFVAEKLDGEPFFGFVRNGALVFTIASAEVAELKPLGSHKLSLDLEFYGERIKRDDGYFFVVFDVYSVNTEVNLPFWERWNKFLQLTKWWKDAFPEVKRQKYFNINTKDALSCIEMAKEGIVLIHADSLFGSFRVNSHQVFHPVRYVKRRWTVDVMIGTENYREFRFLECDFEGNGVYEVDANRCVYRKHKDPGKLANSDSAIKLLMRATPYEYFTAMVKVTRKFADEPFVVLNDKDNAWRCTLKDPLFYLAWPTRAMYRGFSSQEVEMIEKFRSAKHRELVAALSCPDPQAMPTPLTPEAFFSTLSDFVLRLVQEIDRMICPYLVPNFKMAKFKGPMTHDADDSDVDEFFKYDV